MRLGQGVEGSGSFAVLCRATHEAGEAFSEHGNLLVWMHSLKALEEALALATHGHIFFFLY